LAFSQNGSFFGEFPKQGFWETLWHSVVNGKGASQIVCLAVWSGT
jgi:hypothetical protein